MAPKINEFLANHTGSDVAEFIEILGDPNTDYSAYSLLVIEGDLLSNAGQVEKVFQIGTTDANGLWVTELMSNQLENGSLSLLLVEGNTASVGDDIDLDDDGMADTPPWTALIDSVAVTDGDAGDIGYGGVVLTPDFDGETFAVPGASRIPDGTDTDTAADWVRNDFNGAGLEDAGVSPTPGSSALGKAINTPGAANEVAISEISVTALDAVKAEGNSGSTQFTFTLSRTGDTSVAQTVTWTLTGDIDSDDAQFGNLTGTVTLSAGVADGPFSVFVSGDTDVEPDETFTLTLSNPTGGAVLGTNTATGTILDDDTSTSTSAVIALEDFDGGAINLASSDVTDYGTATGGTGGDVFGRVDGQTGGTMMPFDVADDTVADVSGSRKGSAFPSDSLGLAGQNTSAFLAMADPDGFGSDTDRVLSFDFGGQKIIDEISIDMAAIGDFEESSSDGFKVEVSLDGGTTWQVLFDTVVDDNASKAYRTLDNGIILNLNDPLELFEGDAANGVSLGFLDKSDPTTGAFTTYTTSLLQGQQAETIDFRVSWEGTPSGSEPMGLDNFKVTGTDVPVMADVIALEDFEGGAINLVATDVTDYGTGSGGTGGDVFGLVDGRAGGTTMPFDVADDTVSDVSGSRAGSAFPSDSLGIAGQNTTAFLALNDMDGAGITTVDQDRVLEFDFGGLKEIDEISIDMAAMGDFEESASDGFKVEVSLDGGATWQVLFDTVVDEDATKEYHALDDGTVYTLNDPLELFEGDAANGVSLGYLDKADPTTGNFTTYTTSMLQGQQAEGIAFRVSWEGTPSGSEPMGLDNFKVTGTDVEAPAGPQLVISEIMFNPASAEDNWEWVEIFNAGTEAVDLTGYVIDDGNTAFHTAANIAGGVIEAGQSAILFNVDDISAADFEAAWGAGLNLIPVTGWVTMGLNNGSAGDQIGLWASFADYSGDEQTFANTVDFASYTGLADDNAGSYYFADLASDNSDPSNWTLSTGTTDTPVGTTRTSTAANGNTGLDVGSPGGNGVAADVTYGITALDAAKAEGDIDELTTFTFTVTRTGDTSGETTVDYAVTGDADESDFAGPDLPSGVVTFADGETSKTLEIVVSGDMFPEADEGFTVTLSNPTATGSQIAAIGTGTADGTIINDDGVSLTLISDIQGTGDASPLVGQTVTVEAVVVGDFQDGDADDKRNLRGFYIQEEITDEDGNALSSEGIFVFDGTAPGLDVNVGDVVQVTGTVAEYFGETQIGNVTSVTVVGSANVDTDVTRAVISLPAADATTSQDGDFQPDLEAFEGMLVSFADTLTITEQFQLDRFNEIKLVAGDRPYQFTQTNAPDVVGYSQFLEDLGKRTITYDDGLQIQNGPISNLDGFGDPYTTANALQMGDTIDNLTGVLNYQWAGNSASGATWRVIATEDGENVFDPTANEREDQPEDVGGTLTVATLNVLNYFVSIDDDPASGVPAITGPDGTEEPRGADSTDEYDRQLEKLVTTIEAIDADILGLVEIENDPNGSDSLQALVDALNANLIGRTYAYVNTGPIEGAMGGAVEGDAIKVGYIYDPATIALTGAPVILDETVDPNFVTIDTQRPTVVQTFTQISTGESFTAAISHFKSKGSVVNGETAIGDGQGNNNPTRTAAAEALVDFLATDPTGSGDDDFLILGDLNAYFMEDPIQAILDGADGIRGTADDFTDLAQEFIGSAAYSYVFDGQIGTLDYAIANESLTQQVTGVTEWHINSDEADALDYNTDFGRDPGIFGGSVPYRASDHDPVIIGLNLSSGPTEEEPSLVVTTTADVVDAFDGVTSLREALAYAQDTTAGDLADGDADNDGNALDTITFDASVFGSGGTITLASALETIASDVAINGGGDVTIDGAGSFRIFDMTGGVLDLTGLTLTGGSADEGGVIRTTGGSVSITDSVLSNNIATNVGGAINLQSGTTLTVSGTTFDGNISGGGGGAINVGNAVATIDGSTFTNNSVTSGFSGGAIQAFGSAANLMITNSTFVGNVSSNVGGAIISAAPITLINSTVTGNIAPGGGGVSYQGATATLQNTIISGNGTNPALELQDFSGTLIDNGGNVIGGDVSAIFANLTNIDPDGVPNSGDEYLAGALADNGGTVQTVALLADASNPALDIGVLPTGVTTDATGAPRDTDQAAVNNGGTVDAGAVELQSQVTLPTLSVDDVSKTEGDSGTTDFTFTISLSEPISETVTVDVSTFDGTATLAGSDYFGLSETITFAPGEISKTVSVTVPGDTEVELDETFGLSLSNATNATILDGTGLATILNDDADVPPPPTPVFSQPGVTDYDGTRSSVDNYAPDANLQISAGTIAFSFCDDDPSVRQGLVVKDARDYQGGGNHFMSMIDKGDLIVRFQNGSQEHSFVVENINANQEYEVAAVFGPDGVGLYVDGVLVGFEAGFVMDWTGNQEWLNVGGLGWSSRTGDQYVVNPFSGQIADVEIYDRVLTEQEIEDLANRSGKTNSAAPVAVDDTAKTAEDTPVTIAIADLLANDSDADGDPVLFDDIFADAANGSVVDNGDGTLTYTPDTDFNGTDSFAIRVTDGLGGFATSQVTVTVTPEPDAPVAVDDSADAIVATPVTIAPLDNDSDPDGDPLSLILSGNGGSTNGTVSDNGDGTLTYTPNAGFIGTDTISYTVADGTGLSDTGTITVDVSEEVLFPAPVFVQSGVTTYPGSNGAVDNYAPDPSLQISEGTIVFSFRDDSFDGRQGLVVKDARDYQGGGNHFMSMMEKDDLRVRFQNGADEFEFKINDLEEGREYEVAAVFSDAGVGLYLDGALVGFEAGFVMDWTTNQEWLNIGGLGWSSMTGEASTTNPFSGQIADVEIYDSVLSLEQIQTLANQSTMDII